jgi:alkyldihydroxyacetonephosphate synthase
VSPPGDPTRPGEPAGPPVPVATAGGPPRPRLSSLGVRLDGAFLGRLTRACRRVELDDAVRAEAGRDWWPLALHWALEGRVPALPGAVAVPATPEEAAAVLACCREARVPVTVAGGRSGVSAGSVPVFGGVTLSTEALRGVTAVDEESLLVDVLAGTPGPELLEALEAHGLTLGHWPQSVALSTVGGWLACRSAGQYSTRYGKIEDMVVGLDVALADGTLVRLGGRAPRAAEGPDLVQCLVGSEGTLGVITAARLRVRPRPSAEGRRAYLFPDFRSGLDACRRTLRRGATPAVLRLYDDTESQRSFGVERGALLVVLDEGDPGLVDATLRVVDEECASPPEGAAPGLPQSAELVDRWLAHRNDVSALGELTRRGVLVDTVEVAARWAALPALYEAVLAALQSVPGMLAASAHQSHAYPDGACLYFTFAASRPEGEAGETFPEGTYLRAWDATMAATREAGGAISHHHGIGLNRARYLPEALGAGFAVLAAVKRALDPEGILNPGKLGLASPFGEPGWP